MDVRLDGVLWQISEFQGRRFANPICPTHYLRLKVHGTASRSLTCEECSSSYTLPRLFSDEQTYVINKIDSKAFRKMKFINLDDEALPLAEIKVKSEDEKYFVTALLTKSKVGLRLVVYAGEKGKKEKTQIFVEPEIKRVAFDQKDLHPSEVFTKLEATFDDGTKQIIEQKDEK